MASLAIALFLIITVPAMAQNGSSAGHPKSPVDAAMPSAARAVARSSGASTSYNALFDEAKRALANRQPQQAQAEAERAIRMDGGRYEGHVLAAAALRDQEQYAGAAAHLQTAYALAPSDSKQRIRRALSEVRVRGMHPEARRKLDALMLVVNDADKAAGNERTRLLQEFMIRSTAFLEDYPSIAELWLLRAAASLELGYAEMGWIAKYQLDQLGAADSDEPALRNIMAQMERKQWLGTTMPDFYFSAYKWPINQTKLLAENGHAVGQLGRGLHLLSSSSSLPDNQKQAAETEAIEWLKRAAEQGSAHASFVLVGVHPADTTEWRPWMLKAAKLGLKDAQTALASHYEHGSFGFAQNPIESVRWTRKAAAQDDFHAQLALAEAYRKGEGVKRSDEEALRWYRTVGQRALEQGGTALSDGVALVFAADPDPKFRNGQEAVRLARAAAERNSYKNEYDLAALAAAYAETGDWTNASASQQKALDVFRRASSQEQEEFADMFHGTDVKSLVTDYENRLQLYRNQQPYRQPRRYWP